MQQPDETGCFVYQIVGPRALGLRNVPSVAREAMKDPIYPFAPRSLFSVDLVRHSRDGQRGNGPFLRLSDASGWLFERETSLGLCAKRMPVEDGLWTFYVDNYPIGLALRAHPLDEQTARAKPETLFMPMQKIFCDKKVCDPTTNVNFYRVQGTEGWVFDSRGDDLLLLPESRVRCGLFAYRALCPVGIRCNNTTEEVDKTSRSVGVGDIVVGDCVCERPESKGSGPFVRLTDGSGWLFENKANESMLERLQIQAGSWELTVMNAPAGIGLRRQPIDQPDDFLGVKYDPNQRVVCDKKIASPCGVNFYRVKDTEGWVFDKRRVGGTDTEMMRLIRGGEEIRPSYPAAAVANGWSPDYIRGMVAGMDGDFTEIGHVPESRVISFRSSESGGGGGGAVRINVYYSTRTVGTAMEHPSQGKTQLFRRNCSARELADIFQNPRTHTGKGYQQRKRDWQGRIVHTPQGAGVLVEEEESLRHSLVECEEELERVKRRRRSLLLSVKFFDDERARQAKAQQDKIQACDKERQEEKRQLAQQAQIEQAAREAEARRKRQASTCDICHRVFGNANAKRQHRRDVHEVACPHCAQRFSSAHALTQHRNARGHWDPEPQQGYSSSSSDSW